MTAFIIAWFICGLPTVAEYWAHNADVKRHRFMSRNEWVAQVVVGFTIFTVLGPAVFPANWVVARRQRK